MLAEVRESYVSKFDSPITAYTYENVVLAGFSDEEVDDGSGGSVALVGKRLVFEYSNGYVCSLRLPSVPEAIAAFHEEAAELLGESYLY